EVVFGDGSHAWGQAKEKVQAATKEWSNLWNDFATLRRADRFSEKDSLLLWIGEPTAAQRALREAAERATPSATAGEWWSSLGQTYLDALDAVGKVLPEAQREQPSLFNLFQKLKIEFASYDQITRDLVPNW